MRKFVAILALILTSLVVSSEVSNNLRFLDGADDKQNQPEEPSELPDEDTCVQKCGITCQKASESQGRDATNIESSMEVKQNKRQFKKEEVQALCVDVCLKTDTVVCGEISFQDMDPNGRQNSARAAEPTDHTNE